MTSPRTDRDQRHMDTVIFEFRHLIEQHYPGACFEVKSGEDPVGTYLIVRVDVEDPDEVVDVYADKLLSLQVDEELPLYVVPVRS